MKNVAKIFILLLSVLFFLTISSFAEEGDYGYFVYQADKNFEKDNLIEAQDNLRKAILAIWDKIPLTAQNVRLIEDKKTYRTRESNIYLAGEPIYISSEILGYAIKQNKELYAIDLDADFYILDPTGNILAQKQNFARFSSVKSTPATDFTLDLQYSLKGAPPGVYDLKTVLHDVNSEKETEFVIQVEIK